MTQHGSTAFWWTSGISVSGATSPSLFRASCWNVLSGLEWVALFLSCMSRRWVPQCSILSLALFSIKINNIVKAVLKGTDCSLFVDDFALCVSGKTLNRVERAIQLCVNSVQKWVSENGLKFSTSETVCIHFDQQYVFFPQALTFFWEKRL